MGITNQQKGFTLVELIVVIVILGVLSAVAAPKFFDQQEYQERAFKDELVSALRFAQKRAVASGCSMRVEISTTGFDLFRHQNTADCKTAPNLTTPETHPSGGNYSGLAPQTLVATTIIFDALGRTRNAAYAVSNFNDVAGLSIIVNGETGCVTQ